MTTFRWVWLSMLVLGIYFHTSPTAPAETMIWLLVIFVCAVLVTKIWEGP